MKLLHFADLHLGVENYGRPDAATGLSTRLGDFLRTFDEVIDYAIAERVDAVLFAGDAFKTRDPNPTVQRAFAQRILRLSRAAIPTVLLVGNHDLPSVLSRATSVDIYDTLAIEHVRVCRRLEHFTLETRGGPPQVVEITPGDQGQRRVEWAFRPVAARRFVTLRLQASAEEPLVDLRRAIEARGDARDAVVRAFVATTPEGAAKLR